MNPNRYLVFILEIAAIAAVVIGCLAFVKPIVSLESETFYIIQR